MTDTETEAAKVGSVNLLHLLTEDRTLPDGYDGWAIRTVRPDLRSQHGYRYPFPGQVAEAPGPINEQSTDPCPSAVGDGLCAAVSWRGMASGGVSARALLLVAYKSGDILGGSVDSSEGKIRLRRFLIVDLIDGEDLARASGRSANLRYANLRSADLRSADLRSADLRSANLRYANLRYADLGYADLRYADLRYADLRYADLRSANLRSANLRSANLGSANLGSADLRYANLRSADLRSANLGSADQLRYAHWDEDRWTVRSDGLIVPWESS